MASCPAGRQSHKHYNHCFIFWQFVFWMFGKRVVFLRFQQCFASVWNHTHSWGEIYDGFSCGWFGELFWRRCDKIADADANAITETCALDYLKEVGASKFVCSAYFGAKSDVDRMNEFLESELFGICGLDKLLMDASDANNSDRLVNIRFHTHTYKCGANGNSLISILFGNVLASFLVHPAMPVWRIGFFLLLPYHL